MKKMARTHQIALIAPTLILSALLLTGCTNNTEPSTTTEPENTEPATIEEAGTGFSIPEIGIKIALPEEYAITKNTEANRRGSFVSYDFSAPKNPPLFQEIQFFSADSIQQFTAGCDENNPCFFGDYPDLTRYNNQKEAFANSESLPDFELKEFNGRNYFTSNTACTGDTCIIREYTTFTGDTKIDIWVTMENDSQADQADQLFEQFEIIE